MGTKSVETSFGRKRKIRRDAYRISQSKILQYSNVYAKVLTYVKFN